MKYLNALNIIQGVGSQKMKLLTGFFDKPKDIWNASANNLTASKIGDALVEKIIFERERINPDEEWGKLEKENIKAIAYTDPDYPVLFKEIHNPPYILYIKSQSKTDQDLASANNFNFNSRPMIAIVGSRKLTAYGKQVTFGIARDLARSGITIVSGMALGIDAEAHLGALEGKGETIAVMGSSLEDNIIGPRANFVLSRKIMENGALISEYPLNTPANAGTFPTRNRLMASLTLGTLIVEAAKESGSLITANLALEFNREVFAIPGSIFSPQSEGTNDLIKSGAKMVSGAKDILEELKIEEIKKTEKVKRIIPESKEEKNILKILSHESIHIDNIIKLAKLETSAVISTLSIMEMKGMIKDIGGQNYILL